jgi:hypothetical protein
MNEGLVDRRLALLMLVALWASCVSPRAGSPGDGAVVDGASDVPGTAGSGGAGSAGGKGGGEVLPGGPGMGTIGGPCGPSGGCAAGLTCIGALHGTGPEDRVCAPACASVDDCQAFVATSYQLHVPDVVTPFLENPLQTNWRSKTLSRGFVCSPLPAAPAGPKYCGFVCPDLMAVGPDDQGNVACYCLPGYDFNADKTACSFGTSHQCSIFSYGTDETRTALRTRFGIQSQTPACNACNSDRERTNRLGCHSGQYFCDIRTSALNGDCVEVITPDQCVAQHNLSCTCQSSCTNSCQDALTCYGCCSCSPSSTPVAMCGADGGAPADGNVVTDGAPVVGAADGGNAGADAACVSFTDPVRGVTIIATAGTAPTATGGVLGDGRYVTTAVKLYGSAYSPNSPAGSLGGTFRLQGNGIEISYAGSSTPAFYGKGTFTVTGATMTATFSCSSGATTASFDYSVTSPTTVDIIAVGPAYTTVATYAKM